MKESQETAIVPTTQTPAELIPNQTADLIEKSFAKMLSATAGTPYRSLARGYRGDRFPTDSSLKQTRQSTAKAARKT